MKKTLITLTAALFITGAVKAQTIQEGVTHLNADRFKNATNVFEKLLAMNPNNAEAIYWLGQTILGSEEIMGARIKAARDLYEKGLQTSSNHPLIMVGKGHIDLLENKPDAARQMFESALTATRTKKGDDAVILAAVGRAITDSKTGDFHHAVKLLKEATDRDSKNPLYLVELGDAYRKAGKGDGGGDAYKQYNKALELNPNFSLAYLRLAKLFESQRNWTLVLKYLTDAVSHDPGYTAGYYELFYYYFYRQDYAEAEKNLQKYIDSKNPVKDIQDEYLYAQLCWARKDFECAVNKAQSVVNALGDLTKPKVYRLMADAYFEKGDYVNAKKFSDTFFEKKNPDDLGLYDFELRAKILDKTGGTTDEIFNTYIQATSVDTPATLKVDLLKKGVVYFKDNKLRDREAMLLEKVIELKPKPSTINDLFDLSIAYYFSQNYAKSRENSLIMIQQFPDQVYGYEWSYNSSIALDTVKKDSIAVPDALKLVEFSEKDTSKFKKQYISAVRFLAAYYINEAKDKEKSLEYFRKWKDIDVANADKIQEYIDQIEKNSTKTQPKGKPAPKPASKNSSGKTEVKADSPTKSSAAGLKTAQTS